MAMRCLWTGLALVSLMVVPVLIVTQDGALAAGVPKAEWGARKGSKIKVAPKAKKASAPLTQAQPETPLPSALVSEQPAGVIDQSQEVLDMDFVMAAAIAAQGPKDGYASALSEEGILYDANGASPTGQQAAVDRFGSFPADVTLVRTPERALAAGGSGSSWGTYTIKRGETILSGGRYISVWRREVSGWKMISELAAGKTITPPPAQAISGILPKRPTSRARAAQSPVGIPLTVPTLPQTSTTTQATPTP